MPPGGGGIWGAKIKRKNLYSDIIKKIMPKNFLVITAVVISLFIIVYWSMSSKSSKENNIFINSCNELNGKEFTFQNIEPVKGYCYVHQDRKIIGVEQCAKSHIEEYLKFIKQCGGLINQEALKHTNEPENSAYKPLFQCIQSFHRNSRIWVGSTGKFNMTQGSIDGTWICAVESIYPSTTTRTSYLED